MYIQHSKTLRQEDHKSNASLGHRVWPFYKKGKRKKRKREEKDNRSKEIKEGGNRKDGGTGEGRGEEDKE